MNRRLGKAALDALAMFILPWVRVAWEDHTSFVLMRKLGVRTALAIDRHFAQKGLAVIPET